MNSNQRKLLRELMEVGFCLVDTNLYLDTHPKDEKALRLHNNLSRKYAELECMYISNYGPLRYTQMSRYPWQYINSPWPWEIDYCGCK